MIKSNDKETYFKLIKVTVILCHVWRKLIINKYIKSIRDCVRDNEIKLGELISSYQRE